MSFFSGFAGAAAQSYDQSLKQWRQMFDQRAQFDAQMDQRKTEFDTSTELSRKRFDWDREMADLENNWREREFDANQLSQWYDNSMAGWGNMTGAERLALVERFEALDTGLNPTVFQGYDSLLRAQVRDTMAPRDAKAYIANVMNSEIGTNIPSWVVSEALSALQDDPDFANIEAGVNAFLEGNEEEFARYREQEWVGRTLAQDEQRANIAESGARTGNLEANTASIYSDIEMDEALAPIVIGQEKARRDILQSQASQEAIREGRLDEQITASLGETYASIRGMDNENELFRATFEDMVQQVANDTTISTSEATYMVATESARIALAQGNVKQLRASIEQLKAQTANINANTERTGVLMESDRLAITEGQVRIAQDLVANGDVEILREVGRDVLVDVVGEDRVDGLLEELTTIAADNRADDEKLFDTNLRIATAQAEYEEQTLPDRVRQVTNEADYTEWQAQNAERIQAFDEWATREGLSIQRANLQATLDRYAAEASAVGGAPNPLDVADAVSGALRQSPDEIRALWAESESLQADYLIIEDGAANGTLSAEQLQNFATRYNFPQNNMNIGEGIDPQTLLAYMAQKQQQLREQAIGGATSYITMGLRGGVAFTPEELGFSAGLYNAATAPLGLLADPDNPPTPEEITTIVHNSIASAGDNGLNMFQGADAWQLAEEQGLLPMLQENGIRNASEFADYINQQGEEYRTAQATYGNFATLYTEITGNEAPNPQTGEGLQEATVWGNQFLSALREAQRQTEEADRGLVVGGAERRDRRAILGTFQQATGLDVGTLQNMGLVTGGVFGDPYMNDARALENALSQYAPLINNAISGANTLFNW